jgi:hypothetical protein
MRQIYSAPSCVIEVGFVSSRRIALDEFPAKIRSETLTGLVFRLQRRSDAKKNGQEI